MQTNIHGGAEEMKHSIEFKWNEIYVEYIKHDIIYVEYIKHDIIRHEDFSKTKFIAQFHILPVGRIRTIPIGFKNSNFVVTVDSFVSNESYGG